MEQKERSGREGRRKEGRMEGLPSKSAVQDTHEGDFGRVYTQSPLDVSSKNLSTHRLEALAHFIRQYTQTAKEHSVVRTP